MQNSINIYKPTATDLSVTTFPNINIAADLLADKETLLRKELSGLFNGKPEEFDTGKALAIIENLLQQFYEDKDRYRSNSWKSLNFLWNTFVNWSLERELTPLPASTTCFEQFLVSVEQKYKANTLSLFRWTVSTIHSAAGVPNPTDTDLVKRKIKGIKKRKAENFEHIKQASAFKTTHLDLLMGDWRESEKPIERRDLALLTLGYETMLRESELARIKFEHIKINHNGCAVITVPISKTNHSGEPDVITVSQQCTNIITEYLSSVGLDFDSSYYLFKRLHASGKLLSEAFCDNDNPAKPLTGKTVDNIFGNAWQYLTDTYKGLMRNIPKWSGHSARVGACQDLLQQGYTHLQVQQAGRWSSIEMVYRYGRDVTSEESAMYRARLGRT